MIAVDTSMIVAGFASWHEGHASAIATLARKPRIPAHALVEAYSVLTRLPPPHRAAPAVVSAFLADRCAQPPLGLPPGAHLPLIALVAGAGLHGGSIHDALIAATVKHARARLVTRDRRAAATYEHVGVDFELVR